MADRTPNGKRYYAVHIPRGTPVAQIDSLRPYELDISLGSPIVLEDKEQLLSIAKQCKTVRFKTFNTRQEAEASQLFSENGGPSQNGSLLPHTNSLLSTAGIDAHCDSPPPESLTPALALSTKCDIVSSPPPSTSSSSAAQIVLSNVSAEKLSSTPYKTPSKPELSKFRMSVEKSDAELVHEMIWSNPTYLVNPNGDIPTILHEGCRYNACHVASKSGNAPVLATILETISNPEFTARLYPRSLQGDNDQRTEALLDYYLNMPDKAAFETPLHYACKFGHPAAVEVLLKFPQTDLLKTNRNGQTAQQVICERVLGNRDKMGIRREIESKFKNRYYISIYNSNIEDDPLMLNDGIPTIGHPSEYFDLNAETTRALAGPMSFEEATKLYDDLKSSGRLPSSNTSSSTVRSKSSTFRGRSSLLNGDLLKIHLIDETKGLERIARELCHSNAIPWVERWTFCDKFMDLSTEEGLATLEAHLRESHKALLEARRTNQYLNPSLNNSNDNNSSLSISNNSSLSPSSINQQHNGPAEGAIGQGVGQSPLSELCHQLSRLRLDFSEEGEAILLVNGGDGSEDRPTPQEDKILNKSADLLNAGMNSLNINDNSPKLDCWREEDEPEEMSDSDDEENFTTPPTSPKFDLEFYISGENVTRTDYDVAVALQHVGLDPVRHVYTRNWFARVCLKLLHEAPHCLNTTATAANTSITINGLKSPIGAGYSSANTSASASMSQLNTSNILARSPRPPHWPHHSPRHSSSSHNSLSVDRLNTSIGSSAQFKSPGSPLAGLARQPPNSQLVTTPTSAGISGGDGYVRPNASRRRITFGGYSNAT